MAGLSTELTDVTEVEYRQLRLERVVLVGVWTEGTAEQANASLVELARLAETAGSEVLDGLVQRRPRPDPATFIGSGKVEELRDAVQAAEADTVICDGELSPGQLRQLEDKLKVKVIDRTALILDIFAQHARSRDGKAQVELAQLSYLLPRLRGWGEALSRQVGGRAAGGVGIGGRGPGETKIELDRRRIRNRMSKLRREIGAMKQVRETQRGSRRRNEVPSVAIVGYTNAGKSSLLNALTDAGVLVEDALFATLDPTTRRTTTADGRGYTLTDTVGFVRHLPHQLVEAFRSTLEETADADLLLHVVDASDALPEDQIKAVRQVLVEVGRAARRHDAARAARGEQDRRRRRPAAGPAAPPAARRGVRLGPHRRRHRRGCAPGSPSCCRGPRSTSSVLLPYAQGSLVARIHGEGEVLAEEHTPDGTRVRARVGAELATAVLPFLVAAANGADPTDRERPGTLRRQRTLIRLLARRRAVRPLLLAVPAPVVRCPVDDPRLAELSGLVADGDGLWAMADGGRRVQVHRLDPDGCAVRDTRTADIDPVDPEDLARGPDGTLWVGDIGDNGLRRDTVAVIELPADGPARLHRLTYPDGPHDAEALLVDAAGRPIVVVKDAGAGRCLPHRGPARTASARRRCCGSGRWRCRPRTRSAGRSAGLGSRVVTGAAASADGRVVALRSYTDAWLYRVPADGDLVAALTGRPVRVPLPGEPQGEAIAFEPSGTLVSGSETRGGAPGEIRTVAERRRPGGRRPDRLRPARSRPERAGPDRRPGRGRRRIRPPGPDARVAARGDRRGRARRVPAPRDDRAGAARHAPPLIRPTRVRAGAARRPPGRARSRRRPGWARRPGWPASARCARPGA